MRQVGVRLAVKRVVDVVGASIGLLAFAPVMGVTACAIRVSMGTPVLFRQLRPGRYGKPFTLMKFRTMRNAGGPDGRPLPDEQRMTPVGRLVRSLSLDELPQLWNVLVGDMSLVGPRPLLMQYMARYTPEQARRHDVLPGITGWAQINGRNALTHEERFILDNWYVDNWSLGLDATILVSTLVIVATRAGVTASGHVTMPEFFGSPAVP